MGNQTVLLWPGARYVCVRWKVSMVLCSSPLLQQYVRTHCTIDHPRRNPAPEPLTIAAAEWRRRKFYHEPRELSIISNRLFFVFIILIDISTHTWFHNSQSVQLPRARLAVRRSGYSNIRASLAKAKCPKLQKLEMSRRLLRRFVAPCCRKDCDEIEQISVSSCTTLGRPKTLMGQHYHWKSSRFGCFVC